MLIVEVSRWVLASIVAAVFASACATAAIQRPDGLIMSGTVIGEAEISDCYEQCRSPTEPVTPAACELVVDLKALGLLGEFPTLRSAAP